MNNRQKLLELFRAAGVTHVHAGYSGYGDSGSMDTPTTTPSKLIDLDIAFGEVPHPWYPEKMLSRTVEQAVTDLFYELLSKEHGGWENNDGGQGEFTWDIATDTIHLDHGENYTQTEHYTHAF